MNENYPIIVKSYNLTLWYLKKIEKYPKNNRYNIAKKIQQSLLELMLISTPKTKESYSPKPTKR